METNSHVWYACYGSNLCRERFMTYINRCCNKTEPSQDRAYTIEHEMYFAREACTWGNKAIAFINPVSGINSHTLGRIYYILYDQYIQVKGYEGCKYRNEISLGEIDGCKVVTFTDTEDYPRKQPSQEYLDCIGRGLKETYPNLTKNEIEKYLSERTGATVQLILGDIVCTQSKKPCMLNSIFD